MELGLKLGLELKIRLVLGLGLRRGSVLRLLSRQNSSLLHNIDLFRLNNSRVIGSHLFVVLGVDNGSPWGRPHRNHILKHIRMPSLGEIIGKNSVSLVITWLTLESIKRPIGPVNISLLQISDQMFPRNVSIIVAKLSQKVGIAQSPYKSLSVGQFFLELLV